MARFTTLNINFSSVGAGATQNQSVTISNNYINIYKVKITPSISGGSQVLKMYTKNTYSSADLIYMITGSGVVFDPALYDGSTYVEAKVGFLVPYEDEQATVKLHIGITNNDSQTKDFTVSVLYEAA